MYFAAPSGTLLLVLGGGCNVHGVLHALRKWHKNEPNDHPHLSLHFGVPTARVYNGVD